MAITLKSLSSRIDQLESRVNCHLQIDTIAADIDAAELPEDGDVCGRSVRQALRGIVEDIRGLSSKWGTFMQVSESNHEVSKICDHILFSQIHQEKLKKVESYKQDKEKLEENVKKLKEEYEDTLLELEEIENEAGDGDGVVDPNEEGGGEGEGKAADALMSKAILLETKAKQEAQTALLAEKLNFMKQHPPPRHDRIQRNCRLCNLQCTTLCTLCSKDATNREDVFICCKTCLEKHKANPNDFVAMKGPSKKKARVVDTTEA
jgi:hypothetical protein